MSELSSESFQLEGCFVHAINYFLFFNESEMAF